MMEKQTNTPLFISTTPLSFNFQFKSLVNTSSSNFLHPNTYYSKKTFTFHRLKQELFRFIHNGFQMIDTISSGRISQGFMERIMMSITAVNQCRYCSWVHTRMALENGCTLDEIKKIMDFDFTNICEEEYIALTFCHHYAESDRHPSREAIHRFIDYYGVQKARDIYHIISMIYFGNLTGNTVDAFENRMHGRPTKDGSAVLEFVAYFLGGFIVKKIMQRIDKKKLAQLEFRLTTNF
jgi:AhpD family alkylhydroperoxidase